MEQQDAKAKKAKSVLDKYFGIDIKIPCHKGNKFRRIS